MMNILCRQVLAISFLFGIGKWNPLTRSKETKIKEIESTPNTPAPIETGARFTNPITSWLDQFLDKSQYSITMGENDTGGETYDDAYITKLQSWGGDPLTQQEKDSIAYIRLELIPANILKLKSTWLNEVSDAEILRFLRTSNGAVNAAWTRMEKHCKWRGSKRGADSTKYSYTDSNLNYEIFWLGLDKKGVPTLVIRTQMHDGKDYNEDPQVFTGCMVQILEEGKRKYGLGVKNQMNVLLDRGGSVVRRGKPKVEILDFSAIPNLMKLFKHLFSTISDHYPDITGDIFVAPASKFFSICFGLTGRIMDKQTRQKFRMVKNNEISRVFEQLFSADKLPSHLGGRSTTYTSIVTIP